MTVLQRFLHLVTFDTHSNEESGTCPSTPEQLELGQDLVRQMQEIGIQDAHLDAYGYVYGTVPGNQPSAPTIGLIAHMDVSSDAPSKNCKPKLIPHYDGKEIILNPTVPVVLSPEEFPALKNHIGKTLVVTDGLTLLGADDKAGIAEILSAAQFLLNTDLPHGTVRIAFTPDEEIGRGTDHFNLDYFKADYAYTVDGGALGELEYENFNAASATVTIQGRNIHPGSAKGKMRNAILLAADYNALLPTHEIPFCTDGYEGFYHLHQISGTVEQATLQYLIRDHDLAMFQSRKERLLSAAEYLNACHGSGTVSVEITDSYYNMKEKILPHMEIITAVQEAMEQLGISPKIIPIRGGTDGARLSYAGLPCPNLCTGGENYHGRFEYIPVEDMEQTVELLKKIVMNAASQKQAGTPL